MSFSRNATVARIRAIYGKRLRTEHYKELITKKSVPEVAEYLKRNTRYSGVLASIDTNKIHRGFLEDILRKSNFEMYVRLCKFQKLDEEPFYRFLIEYDEIAEILNAILYLNAGASGSYIADLPTFLLSRASFDLLEIAKIRSFKQLLNVLSRTDYYPILKDVKVDESGKVDFTKCEMKLRTHYLKKLLRTVERDFKGQAREELKHQIEVQVDLINIINAYRMKNAFNAGADEIKKNTLPFYGRISVKKEDKLFEARDIEEFLAILSRTIYGRQLDDISQCTDSIQFERQMRKLRFNIAKRALAFSGNVAVSLYSVTYLFEVELNNIIRIVEGIRYGKSTSYIESLLIIS